MDKAWQQSLPPIFEFLRRMGSPAAFLLWFLTVLLVRMKAERGIRRGWTTTAAHKELPHRESDSSLLVGSRRSTCTKWSTHIIWSRIKHQSHMSLCQLGYFKYFIHNLFPLPGHISHLNVLIGIIRASSGFQCQDTHYIGLNGTQLLSLRAQ